MPAAQIFQLAAVFEDSSAYILGRIRNLENALITQASLSEISLRVYDPDNPPDTTDEDDPAVIAFREITIADDVYDTLQTDSGWNTTADPDGFNFKVEVLPEDIPAGGKKARFEFKFTDAVDKISHAVVEFEVQGLYRS